MITEQQRKGMMSSLRHDWATPRSLFEMLNREFRFTLDVCAQPDTAVCDEFFCSTALDRDWKPIERGAVWCNPPYGAGIGKWIEKGQRESRHGNTVVMLLPARTDTQWFHAYCLKAEIRFLCGRLSFDNQKRGRAPFPSMLVIFRPANENSSAPKPTPEATA